MEGRGVLVLETSHVYLKGLFVSVVTQASAKTHQEGSDFNTHFPQVIVTETSDTVTCEPIGVFLSEGFK